MFNLKLLHVIKKKYFIIYFNYIIRKNKTSFNNVICIANAFSSNRIFI